MSEAETVHNRKTFLKKEMDKQKGIQ